MLLKVCLSIIVVLTLTGCNKQSALNELGLYTKSDLEKERERAAAAERKLAELKVDNQQIESNDPKIFTCNKYNTVNYNIATGSKTGTYYQIGKNLSEFVAKDACINLKVLNSNGSIENVKRLAKEPGLKLAIVQSDVFQKFKDMAESGKNKQYAANIINKLKVVKPLYFEEVHFITRKNAGAEYIQDIENLRINIGPQGSGTSMTTSNIYKELFGKHIPMENRFTYGYDEAFQRLLGGDLDVVVYVAGQPTSRLDRPAAAKKLIKFLKYSNTSPMQSNAYYKTKIQSSSYKWLDQDIDTLAVKSYLITFNYQGSARKPLSRLSQKLNENFHVLQQNGHPKWNSVNKDLKRLPGGWTYYEPSKFAYNYKFNGECTQKAKDLGLCTK